MNKIYSSISLSLAVLAGATLAHAESGFTYLDDPAEAGGYDVTATMQKLPVELSLSEQANGDGYRLRVTPDGAQFGVEAHGALQTVATMQGHLDPGAVVAQRRGAMWRIITGKRVILEAEDDRWHEGKIGFRGSLKDSRVQPIEDVYFDDDFMRVSSEVAMQIARTDPHQGVKIADVKIDETKWKSLTGVWNTTGLSENEQAQVAQSANPFAFKTDKPGTNLAVTGPAFWDNYVMSASLRPEGATAIGIAMYVQDDKNYLLFHWQAKGPMELRAVVNGQVRVLDQAAGGFEPKQWYRVRFSNADGFLRAYIDDTEVLRAHTQLFGRGPAGVYAEIPPASNAAGVTDHLPDAADAPSAVFDDVSIRSIHDVQDDFKANVPGRWQTISGAWNLGGAAQPTGGTGAFAVLGETGWKDYVTSAQIMLPPDAAAGLVLDHQVGKGAYLLRVAGSKAKVSFAGKAQIVKLGKGTSIVLGETPIGSRFDGRTMDWDFAAERGYLKATANDVRVVDAFDESLSGGRAGMFAERGTRGVPQLTAFSVSFPVTKATWAKVPELYDLEQQAQTMGGWSTPEGFWVTDAPVSTIANTSSMGADTTVRWHKGTFWGDGSVRFNLPALDAKQELKLMFDNVQASAATRNRSVTLSLKANAGVLKGSIARTGTAKVNHWDGEMKLNGPVAGQPIEVEQRGTFIIVRVGKPDVAHTLLVAHLV